MVIGVRASSSITISPSLVSMHTVRAAVLAFDAAMPAALQVSVGGVVTGLGLGLCAGLPLSLSSPPPQAASIRAPPRAAVRASHRGAAAIEEEKEVVFMGARNGSLWPPLLAKKREVSWSPRHTSWPRCAARTKTDRAFPNDTFTG